MKSRWDHVGTLPCKIEGCGKVDVHGSHGMCGKHAQRMRRYGDPHYVTPENRRRVLTREAQPSLGKLKRTTYKKLLGRHEHRRVMEMVLGRPLLRTEVVHHKNGDKHDNRVENLELISQSDHIKEHWPAMMAARIAKNGH